jgi:hypothetical protein
VRPGASQRQRGCASDAARGAGDERDSIAERLAQIGHG